MELIVLGAGGFAREVRTWAEHCGFKVVAFFASFDVGKNEVDGLPVIRELKKGRPFVVGVGDPKLRKKLANMAFEFGIDACEPIFHPAAFVGRGVKVGDGTIVCPGSVLTTNVYVGMHCAINLNCTIGHDTIVGDYAVLSPGVNLSGNCNVERLAYLGSNSVVRERVSVGEGAILGAGGVLLKHLPSGETWVGNPARPLVRQCD